MPQVVIANRLRDGVVVFLGSDGRWVETLAECPASQSGEAGEKLLDLALQAERKQEVVDPTLIDVETRDGVQVACKRREDIRSKGPTIRPDLGKQAGN